MCAQYTIKGSKKKLAQDFKTSLPTIDIDWEERITPFASAPVVVSTEGKRTLQAMQFSLTPSWSKEPKVKFATYNARLTSYDEKKGVDVPIFEKPTWRDAFSQRRCLIPISEFIEPAYTGRLAGHMIRFFQEDQTPLAAAGIWDEWICRKTGQVIDSFAILTSEPDPFVKDLGHDRMPVFLSGNAYEEWIEPGKKDPKTLLEFLTRNRATIQFKAESDRPLKAGWEKRARS